MERDSTKIALPYGADGAVVPVQKFRDVQKLYAAMTDGKMEYVLYGAENQDEIHYAMPVKNDLYDALEYAGQVEEAAKSHRKEIKGRFRELERRAADVIEAITNSGIKYDESEEVVDVCQALQDIRKEERKIGELNKAKEDAVNFYELGVDVEKIAQGVGYAVETVKQWIGLE